jgi:hypothetical protein
MDPHQVGVYQGTKAFQGEWAQNWAAKSLHLPTEPLVLRSRRQQKGAFRLLLMVSVVLFFASELVFITNVSDLENIEQKPGKIISNKQKCNRRIEETVVC